MTMKNLTQERSDAVKKNRWAVNFEMDSPPTASVCCLLDKYVCVVAGILTSSFTDDKTLESKTLPLSLCLILLTSHQHEREY
ncbi:hypothetical protein L2E82_51578 [Cichorium intybus]|nr:hypothetical protein L2E82_51578 [Cichorium intybus]